MKPTGREDSVAYYPTENFRLWKKYETAFWRNRTFNNLSQQHENRHNSECENYWKDNIITVLGK